MNGVYRTKILTFVLCVGDAASYAVGMEGLALGEQVDGA